MTSEVKQLLSPINARDAERYYTAGPACEYHDDGDWIPDLLRGRLSPIWRVENALDESKWLSHRQIPTGMVDARSKSSPSITLALDFRGHERTQRLLLSEIKRGKKNIDSHHEVTRSFLIAMEA